MAGAAFFDLDRTLIAGSSSFQFGRAAYKAGMLTRKDLTRDAYENLRFRLQGSTDKTTDLVDKKTKGKYSDKIETGRGKTKDALDKLDGKDDNDLGRPRG